MSMDTRYQDKIRKLLALSQSDNPHEAETAKRMATSLMKKHRIDEDELNIVSTHSRPIKRKTAKEYEHILVSAVMDVSGCYAMVNLSPRLASDRMAWSLQVEFIGIENDAELAAYSFDVLHQQVEAARKKFQKEYSTNAVQADVYCKGWVCSAACKLINVFGERERPESVAKHRTKKTAGADNANVKKAKSSGSRRMDSSCKALGMSDGELARLNQATTDQQEKQLRLGGGL